MTYPHVDTDITTRLLTGDDAEKQAASAALFQRVERQELTLTAPDTVIADAVYVLTSPRLYRLPRARVAAMLTTLVRLPRFRIVSRRVVLRALALYGDTHLDFGDAMIVASTQETGATTVYSYDTDFDRVPGVARNEP